jgi:predicted ATPase
MSSLITGYEYDIFISYRQKDNRSDQWVTNFVNALQEELDATFKEDISIYFDANPHHGLHETHDVDGSLKEKIKCLVFIPIVSQTYCDPKSFAWQKEFLAFVEFAKSDPFGLDIKLPGGNVAKRILPIRIHEIDEVDKKLFEDVIGGVMRPVDFIFQQMGVNRPLLKSDLAEKNLKETSFRNQINKTANAFKDLVNGIKNRDLKSEAAPTPTVLGNTPRSRGRVPKPAEALYGRDAEQIRIMELLRKHRLVTITGPGGMGKTRLCQEVANQVSSEFPDGIVYVSLATLTDAKEVIPTLALTLDIKEGADHELIDGISAYLSNKNLLLVLDNLEQVIEATQQIAELLTRCSPLKLLVTSRTPLKITQECEFPLGPLSVPESNIDLDSALQNSAIAFFADKARKTDPGFLISKDNVATILAICRKVEGIPLALELAAARIRIMSPDELLKRLVFALDVLASGSRDLPERHQTLRTTIDWSFSLLDEAEKVLFRRLAVFSGGFTLEAIEAVCFVNKKEAMAGLKDIESLMDKGLLQRTDIKGRLNMLHIIKDFALEKLIESNEMQMLQFRHANYFLQVAARLNIITQTRNQLEIMQEGFLEESNILSALDFLLEASTENQQAETIEMGLQICGECAIYWHISGKHISAMNYIERFLELPACPKDSIGRCMALTTAGIATQTLGQFDRTEVFAREGYEIANALKQDTLVSINAVSLAMNCMTTDSGRSKTYINIAKQSAEKAHNTFLSGLTLAFGGIIELVSGDPAAAKNNYEKALTYQQADKDYEGRAISLSGLAQLEAIAGNAEQALILYHESLASFATVGDRPEEARILSEIAGVYLNLQNLEQATRYLVDSVQAYQEVGSTRGVGLSLIGLGAVQVLRKNYVNALTIIAAAEFFAEQKGVANVYSGNFQYEPYVKTARENVAQDLQEEAVKKGRELSVEEALAMCSIS